jgi:hypothetical protein
MLRKNITTLNPTSPLHISISYLHYQQHCVMRNSVVGNKLLKLTMDHKNLRSNISSEGCSIAQAVIRRLPGFEARSSHMGFVVDKVALGQVSSEYFGHASPRPTSIATPKFKG